MRPHNIFWIIVILTFLTVITIKYTENMILLARIVMKLIMIIGILIGIIYTAICLTYMTVKSTWVEPYGGKSMLGRVRYWILTHWIIVVPVCFINEKINSFFES